MKTPKLLKYTIEGFSLIEISISLIIIGVMTGSILKGRDLLNQAKARAVADDFARISTAIMLYVNEYDASFFKTPADVWKKLAQVELLEFDTAPSSKFGGTFAVALDNDKYVLRLGTGDSSNEAFLTLTQMLGIFAKLQDSSKIIVRDKGHQLVFPVIDERNKDGVYTIAIILQ
ncbi:MAG: prepilin-type N-terminal cleavage/methylation domain-containing protein [Holosporales bacterium]|jgi:prepilin-type N-terminal cleavage/methylation domain-containing protein|nr:prepilin-type N-terminal cleavage/methylation domain-containing protein [Holosporales bacterium]